LDGLKTLKRKSGRRKGRGTAGLPLLLPGGFWGIKMIRVPLYYLRLQFKTCAILTFLLSLGEKKAERKKNSKIIWSFSIKNT